MTNRKALVEKIYLEEAGFCKWSCRRIIRSPAAAFVSVSPGITEGLSSEWFQQVRYTRSCFSSYLLNVFYFLLFTQAKCALQVLSAQSGETLPDNFIGFDSVPDKVVDGSVVRVRYQCSRQCQLAVEVVVSTLQETDLVVFRRKWISSRTQVYRIHQVPLRLPPSISYQLDFFNRNILDTQNVTVRAWLDSFKNGSELSTYRSSMLRIYKVLQIIPPSEWPSKPPTGCPSWSAQLMWQMTSHRIHQCPHESDVIDMLKFPLASTGEHFGVIRRFQPFIDRALERARLHAVTQPSVTLSVWIYLLKWCQKKLCGIIHHVNGKSSYDTLLMQLTDTGGSLPLIRLTGADEAFQARAALPLWKWIRLDCYIQDSKVIGIKCHRFRDSIHYDDTDGYFVIGGSRYLAGIAGYFGPIRYYRFGTKQVKCKEVEIFALFITSTTTIYPMCKGCIMELTQQSVSEGFLGLKHLWSAFNNSSDNTDTPPPPLPCIFQGHVYSLIGASGDDRFALMHAGYKHLMGIDGFPKDLDMAYSYYSNVGTQSSIDRSRIHENTQYAIEHIYLNNEEDLSRLTHETSDDFQYLKFKAERGDIESQKHMGTMLYWGQNGVSKDIVSAVKWFERSAMQMKDPSAMYDYSILLMKGQGVKRNNTRGFRLMKKAAAMGSINALNGLGWYHGTVLKDHKTAVKFFEQAALNGSHDGMFNLGIYHLSGLNPDRPQKNESAAFEQFLNASELGHIAASVEAAWYLSTGYAFISLVCEQNGHLGFMIREALQAYLQGSWQETFVKYLLAAQTGLGLAQSNVAHLCEELNLGYEHQWRYHNYSILNSDPHPSGEFFSFHFALNPVSLSIWPLNSKYLSSFIALLKMGDYYYYHSPSTQEDSLSLAEQAISMYSRAALAGSPQVTDLLQL
uniref:SEL1L family member 3 n=1 Tax=Amphilophus citrinellus TaxID=61819 RepID=A0A3Q0QU68_AMPCI